MDVLGDDADGVADVGERRVAQVDAADAHGAAGRVVEPGHEPGDRRLAGAGRADEGQRAAGLDAQRDAVEDLVGGRVLEAGDALERGERHLGGRRVAEADVVELDGDRARRAAASVSAASTIVGSRSSTSSTRSKLTSVVITSTCTFDSDVSGPYSRSR